MSKRQSKLVVLYEKMSVLTAPECASCRAPHSCCDEKYCELAIDFAKEKWGIELKSTGYSKLPLMGPSGCTAAPHLRPICTVHTCDISSLGFKKNDPAWTKKYFRLRTQIERLEDGTMLEDL